MNREIPATELKARLSAVLRDVERGEEYLVTRNGKPVAELRPNRSAGALEPVEAVQRIKALRGECRLGDIGVRELIEDGRRY